MSAEQPDYIADVEYTADFFPHLAPAWLAYIARVNGLSSPPLEGPFTWCELGCGKGISPLLLASLHPRGEFHACDILPAHIEYAERLRREGSVGNVSFHARGVHGMLAADIPAFDFVVMHGLYSYVPDAVRGEIRDFLRAKLKPGGLVMVSYNALPGWSHVQPLRNLLQCYGRTRPGDTLAQTREALAYVRQLADAGAGYFAVAPAAVRHLERIAKEDIRYVVHEYMTPHSDAFYFAGMAKAMGEAGLAFAGSMTAADNHAEWMLPPRFAAMLPPDADRATLETHRDFVMNTTFRRDLFAAQPVPPRMAGPVPLEQFTGLTFALAHLPERLPLANNAGGIRFDLGDVAAHVRGVHATLSRGPASAGELLAALPDLSAPALSALLQRLVVAQHVAPGPPASLAPGWRDVHSAIVGTALREASPKVPLPCAATGLAAYAETVYAVNVQAASEHDDVAVAASSVLARLRAHAHPVNRQEGATSRPATDAEILEAAAASWRQLRDASSADGRLMRLLGVLR